MVDESSSVGDSKSSVYKNLQIPTTIMRSKPLCTMFKLHRSSLWRLLRELPRFGVLLDNSRAGHASMRESWRNVIYLKLNWIERLLSFSNPALWQAADARSLWWDQGITGGDSKFDSNSETQTEVDIRLSTAHFPSNILRIHCKSGELP